jgi:hypothetical protein
LTENTGEVAQLDDGGERNLSRARALATLLDSSIPIPGTTRRIGLDPLLGLIPFVGDFVGALLSAYIVLAAAFAGAPTFTVIRMIVNVGIDTLVGSVPLLGDVFDAGWKSNTMNVALFEKFVAANRGGSRSTKEVSKLLGLLVVVSALVALALFTFVVALLFFAIRQAISGS